MADTPNNLDREPMPKPSITVILAIALAISLTFSGHLLLRSDVRAVIFSPRSANDSTASPALIANPAQPEQPIVPTSMPNDTSILMAQLQDMQNQMQAATAQLEQKSQAAGLPPSGSMAQAPGGGEDVAALWAEIEQLNQQMQPLMAQLEVVSANRSSRPASEWFALRTKVNTIHMRLADLTRRVQAAQARANIGSGPGAAQWAAPSGSTGMMTSPNQASYEQLYQNMIELQHLMHQMQGNHPPTP